MPLNDWKALIDSKTFAHPEISAHSDSIANYVNNSEDFRNMNNQFRTNKKIDRIEVIADGRSEQKATTVDVYIRYADGSNWDPGSGEGIYFFKESTTAWVKL